MIYGKTSYTIEETYEILGISAKDIILRLRDAADPERIFNRENYKDKKYVGKVHPPKIRGGGHDFGIHHGQIII